MGAKPTKCKVLGIKQLETENGLVEWMRASDISTTVKIDGVEKVFVGTKPGKRVTGGYSQLSKLMDLTFEDGSTQTVFCKVSRETKMGNDFACKMGTYRESDFYNYYNDNIDMFDHFHFPEILFAVNDKQVGRSIILQKYIEGSENLMKVFGDMKYKRRPDLERPIKLGTDIVTTIEMARHVARALGDWHGKFWMNEKWMENPE